MFDFKRLVSHSNSIAISTGLSAAFAIVIVIVSMISSVFQIDSLASTKQTDTLQRLLQQHGYALARELKVQTLWSEGYQNSRQLNTEWMNNFYGPYLNRLLGYDRLYVLNGSNEPVYSHHHGETAQPNAYDRFGVTISDMITA
ncbi:MAG: CHASE4 domain-containing protein, partial [Hyphomicrobium sp.]